ncbi:kinase-like domain-containing protein [Phlebopus sp. FC_14]|nr:kinase-like domain-containing protein [Phlebopus sp. FC_14]
MITLTEQAGSPPDLTERIRRLDGSHCDGGSFGDIYKCLYDSPSGTIEVAVKVLRFPPDNEEAVEKMEKTLHRELGIWKRLVHSNVVPFLGVTSGFGDYMSLVSKWMPNGNLGVYLKEHDDRLSVVDRFHLLEGTIAGLRYLHSNSIIHGDLTPGNVLVDGSLCAQLADFGYASVTGTLPKSLEYLFWATQCPGAVRWAAPERFHNEDHVVYQPTTKSDIYSFGCIMLQVLSGKEPWWEINTCLIPVRLYQGKNPGRPSSRVINDDHWELIQSCWLPVDKRLSAFQLEEKIAPILALYHASGVKSQNWDATYTKCVISREEGNDTVWTKADISDLLSYIQHSDSASQMIAELSGSLECAWSENGHARRCTWTGQQDTLRLGGFRAITLALP